MDCNIDIRVALFCDSLPPVLDGVSRVLLNYAQELTNRQTPVCVVGPNIKGAQEIFTCNTLLLPAVRPKIASPYPITLPFEARYVAKKLNQFTPTIIHAHSPFVFGNAAHKVARRLNIPSVATLHSRYKQDFLDKTGSKFITKQVVKRINHCYSQFTEVWALNPGVAEELRSYGYSGNITIVGNATELVQPEREERANLRQAGRAHAGVEADTTALLLFVGQHRRGKGVFTILQALVEAERKHLINDPWKMVFVGAGSDKAAMEQYIAKEGISDKVTLLGSISDRETIKEIYAGADLFLFPSHYDCDPIVPREAAAMGTPSILLKDSYATSSSLYTHNKTAFLIEDSPEALSVEITRVLNNKNLLNSVSTEAMTQIPKTWASAITEVEEHYTRIIREYHR